MQFIEKLRYFFSFLNYRFKANSAHGTHSPFVFDLYKQVIAPSRKDDKLPNLKSNLSKYPKNWERFDLVEDIRGTNRIVWEKILQNPEFTVTIDLFAYGLAFVRPQQRKEHFVLKY